MDELAFMGKMQGGIESRLIYGRPSHVIGYGINNFIGFAIPDFVGLTKRLITMLVLFSSIVATLIHFEIPRLRAVGLASFAVMAHQVDWQHNGLVAFFGGYNLFLGFFLWALILNERAQVTARIYILVFLLIFLSFTSELFVILTLIYIAIKALQVKNSSPFYKGPIASATFVYLFLFIILRAIYEDPTRIGGVSSLTYAMGSVSKFSPTDIVAGTLISFINSVPYFSSLELPNIVEICVASILAGSFLSEHFI
jgi:hypothetical protein